MKKYLLIFFILTGCYSAKTIIQKPIDFGTPIWTADFTKANISDDGFYNENTITLAENVQVKNGELFLFTKPYYQTHKFWFGERYCKYSTGWVDFQGTQEQPYGTWEAEIALPEDSWPAFWLLHKRHFDESTFEEYEIQPALTGDTFILIPNIQNAPKIDLNWCVTQGNKLLGYVSRMAENGIEIDRKLDKDISGNIYISPDHITPEVDIMEVLENGKIRHSIHWGYARGTYNLYSDGKYIKKPEKGKKYLFACTITPEGYTFYIDRTKTFEFTNKDAVSSVPCYVILNNAKHKSSGEGESTMIVHSLKYYSLKN